MRKQAELKEQKEAAETLQHLSQAQNVGSISTCLKSLETSASPTFSCAPLSSQITNSTSALSLNAKGVIRPPPPMQLAPNIVVPAPSTLSTNLNMEEETNKLELSSDQNDSLINGNVSNNAANESSLFSESGFRMESAAEHFGVHAGPFG